MNAELYVSSLFKYIGFDHNSKVDQVCIVLTLILSAFLLHFFPEQFKSYWFLLIAVYFSLRLFLNFLRYIWKSAFEAWRRNNKIAATLNEMNLGQKGLVIFLLRQESWGKMQLGNQEFHDLEHLRDGGVLEVRGSSPNDDMERLEASLGNTFEEAILTKSARKYLTKSKGKNARRLGLVE